MPMIRRALKHSLWLLTLATVISPCLTEAQTRPTCASDGVVLPANPGARNNCSASFEANRFQGMAIDNATQTGLDLQPGFTIEAWVLIASTPTPPANYVIASKFSGEAAGASYIFRYQDNGQGPNINLAVAYPGGGAMPTLGVEYELPLREWHHVAVTYSTTGTARFFVDGVSIGSVSEDPQLGVPGPTSIMVGNAGFAIGAFVTPSWLPPLIQSNPSLQFFDGLLDEVRVWNIVRTRAQIAAGMEQEILATTPGLVGYWQFERGNGVDSTPNHNDLTNFGATFTRNVPFRR